MATDKKKKNKKKGASRQEMQRLLHGPAHANVMQSLNPKQRKRIRRVAKRRGLTVAGLVSPVPTHLKERSRSGVRREATRTVNKAYAPVTKTLDQQETRIKALDDKRETDLKNWRDWLTTETAKLEEQNITAQDQVRATQADIQDDVSDSWQRAEEGARDAADQRTGNVSDNQESLSLDLSAEELRGVSLVANERDRTESMIGANTESMARTSANSLAAMAAMDARRQADTWNALKDVADDKEKLVLERAAATSQEVARLLDTEIQKADSNRQFQAALQKLGIDLKELKFEQKKHRDSQRLAYDKLAQAMDIAELNNAIDAANVALRGDELTEKQRHNKELELRAYEEYKRKKIKDRFDRRQTKWERENETPKKSDGAKYRDIWDQAQTWLDGGIPFKAKDEGVPPLFIEAIRAARQNDGVIPPSLRRAIKEQYHFNPKYN